MIQIVKMLIGLAFMIAGYQILGASRLPIWQWVVGAICIGIAFDLMRVKRGGK